MSSNCVAATSCASASLLCFYGAAGITQTTIPANQLIGNMLSALIILALSTSITNAQIDGEFWWLKDKLAEIKGVKPDPVKYEEVSEYENDETDKVVFRDKNVADEDTSNGANGWNFRFQDDTQLTWADNRRSKATKVQSMTTRPNDNNDDVLDFKFPENDNFIWKDLINATRKNMPSNTTDKSPKNKTVFINDKVTFKVYKQETTQVQNICTYLKKSECKRRNGLVYVKPDRYEIYFLRAHTDVE